MTRHHDRHKHGRTDKGNKHVKEAGRQIEVNEPTSPRAVEGEMEGEGSRTAARSYNEKLRSFIDEKRVEPAAKEAEDFVERHPEEAAAAEEKAKAGPTPILRRVEELVTEGRAMWHRASDRVRHVIRRRIRRRA